MDKIGCFYSGGAIACQLPAGHSGDHVPARFDAELHDMGERIWTPTDRPLPPVPASSYPPGATELHVHVEQPQQTRQPNHLLHAVMTLLTGGIWLPVWLIAARRARRRG